MKDRNLGLRWRGVYSALCMAVCSVAWADGTKVELLLRQFDEMQDGKEVAPSAVGVANGFMQELSAEGLPESPIVFGPFTFSVLFSDDDSHDADRFQFVSYTEKYRKACGSNRHSPEETHPDDSRLRLRKFHR